VRGELSLESLQGRLKKDDGAVGMTACAATADIDCPSLQAQQVIVIRAVTRDALTRYSQCPQAEETWPALS
jgi:hypothetical protein